MSLPSPSNAAVGGSPTEPQKSVAAVAAASPVAAHTAASPVAAHTAAQVADPVPTAAVADPGTPWALQVSAPVDPRKQFIADQLTAWTTSSLGWIAALPVPDALKVNLEGTLWTLRRGVFNLAPTVAPITLTGLSSAPVDARVDAVDPEGDAITYRLVSGPKSGNVQLNSDGTFTYTPGAGFDGVDSFVVVAQDGGLHINLVDPFRGAGTGAGALFNQGAIKYSFNYTTGAEYWSTDARAALQTAANTLSAYFLVTAPVVVNYDVTGINDPTKSLLASAGSNLISQNPGYWQTVVQNKLLTGVDSNGAAPDGGINWNWSHSWSLGDTVDANSYDFKSTAMHELLHSFGFLSYVDKPGSNTDKEWTLFASFLVTAAGTKPIGSDYAWSSDFDPYLTGAYGGLYFDGANAVAGYGGQLVPLYTPNPWEDGSSMSHLDDATFTGANQQIMNATTDTGLGIRVLSPIERGILKDIGYTVVIPPPGT
ncbi:Ig-like domain-containing protein [Mycolicibacterium sp.]|uniref:Ig-like domain-containing protein n=1 Tax=Mycolicibacterium sp. TaxID=2320850 RepID=UPI0025D9780A|nr:Ig-like domain-containing protein [Mycolicibacterium sp.]